MLEENNDKSIFVSDSYIKWFYQTPYLIVICDLDEELYIDYIWVTTNAKRSNNVLWKNQQLMDFMNALFRRIGSMR